MDSQLLHYLDLLRQGRSADADPALLRDLQNRYPYFATLDVDLVEKLAADSHDSDDIKSAQTVVALSSSNPDDISVALNISSDADFYGESKPQHEKMTTERTIDSFLERYGNNEDNDKEMAMLEKLIFNPVAPDYTASLESLEPADKSTQSTSPDPDKDTSDTSAHQDRLIDAFIARNSDHAHSSAGQTDLLSCTPDETATLPAATTPTPPATDASESHQHALLTESLAKIYIKKGRYAKAFEIIHSLSLKYPEKSCYFADQLRFLHKLMLIQELQQKNAK